MDNHPHTWTVVEMYRDQESARRPFTSCGAALLRFLEKDTVVNAVQLLRQSPTCSDLAFQALVILTRRKFAQDHDAHRMSIYVNEALSRKGPASESRVTYGNSLLRSVLVVDNMAPRLPIRHQGMVLDFVVSLAGELKALGTPAVDVIEAAEFRLKRVSEKKYGHRIWRRARSRRFLREMSLSLATARSADPAPATPIGNILEAMALYDFVRANGLPDDRNPVRVDAITAHVFAAIVNRSFQPVRDALSLDDLVARAARRANSPLVTVQEVQNVIQDQLGPPGSRIDLESALITQAKLCLIVEIVEEVGLLPREIRGFILDAERSFGRA